MRPRFPTPPRHGTVVAYLALFLALTGGAFAASKVGSRGVINGALKSTDLKNNKGVRGLDVRQGSLGGPDVRAGSLRGVQLADDSVTGADVNEPSLSVSQLVARLGGAVNAPLSMGAPVPLVNSSYTQAANESNVLIAGGQVTFQPSCTQPRDATLYLLVDSPALSPASVVGSAQVADSGTGAATRRFTFGAMGPGGQGLALFRQSTAVNRQFFVYGSLSCNSGSGATFDSAGVDVVAER